MRNFQTLWCQSTCSPIQASFMEVKNLANGTGNYTGKTYVNAVDYYMSNDFVFGMYNSCSGVMFGDKKALPMVCGKDKVKDCPPDYWLKFLGTPTMNTFAPFEINFREYSKPKVEVENVSVHLVW